MYITKENMVDYIDQYGNHGNFSQEKIDAMNTELQKRVDAGKANPHNIISFAFAKLEVINDFDLCQL